MQKVMVMCGARKRRRATSAAFAVLVTSAVLAAGCATLHKSMLTGAVIGVGTGTAASVAERGGEEAEAMNLNSTAWRYTIERSVL